MNNQEYQLKKMALAVKGMFAFAAIIGAFAFLVQSTSPAMADSPTQTYATGRYMMQFQAEYNGDVMNWYVLVWDTESGRSKFYFGGSESQKMVEAASSFNLPSSPL